MAGDAHGDKTQEEPQAQDDPFEDQVACARYRAERDALAQRMEEVASESDLLLDCPFCGARPYVQVYELDETCVEARVVCPSCHVSTAREFQSWKLCYLGDDLTRTLAIGRAISLWNRRAELTCHRVEYKPTRNLICSECGYGIPRALDRYAFVNYCPHCGARIVEEEA